MVVEKISVLSPRSRKNGAPKAQNRGYLEIHGQSSQIAVIGPRVSPKVSKRAVTPKLGVMMEPRFEAENLPKIHLKGSMVKPCWLLIEKQELANKEPGTYVWSIVHKNKCSR